MNLIEGKTYIIDADHPNGGDVILVRVYGKLFCRVKDPDTGGEWDTMINRLSEKPNDTGTTQQPQ
jgi:hypothetical protein